MECSTEKVKIKEAAVKFVDASFNEGEGLSTEQKVDKLLDSILGLKKIINDKITKIETHIKILEEITWYDLESLDEDARKNINGKLVFTRGQ